MVFWSTYPLTHVIESFWNQDRFRSEVFDKPALPSPTGQPAELLSSREGATEIRQFLRSYFGDPPRTPILDLSETDLLSDHVFLVRDGDQIVGTIRYHFIGNLITSQKEPIHVVDAFCIHPEWRRKGVGDYLLTELHRYVNTQGISHAVFLKEGAPLSILHRPLYTGWYRYRRRAHRRSSPHLTDLTIQEAYRIMDVYRSIRPNLFLIRNEHSTNQIWKWFRKGQDRILIGIQDTHQRISTQTIGWITTWIESPLVTEESRGEAADAVSDDSIFEYMWINEQWSGSSPHWKKDGAFHWYMYQWSTCVSIDVSYGMMM